MTEARFWGLFGVAVDADRLWEEAEGVSGTNP
jgi:hypothetical protein